MLTAFVADCQEGSVAEEQCVVYQGRVLKAAAELIVVLAGIALVNPSDDAPQQKLLTRNPEGDFDMFSRGS